MAKWSDLLVAIWNIIPLENPILHASLHMAQSKCSIIISQSVWPLSYVRGFPIKSIFIPFIDSIKPWNAASSEEPILLLPPCLSNLCHRALKSPKIIHRSIKFSCRAYNWFQSWHISSCSVDPYTLVPIWSKNLHC